MKQTKFLTALLLLAVTLLMTACQKDVTPPQQGNVTKEKLVGTYKITSMELKMADGTKEDLLATLPDCEKESTQALNANLTWNCNSACDPADNETNTWTYIDTKQIVINGLLCKIASFNGKNLKLSIDNFLGMQGTLTETLTKQ